MKQNNQLAIIIPAYNEGETIAPIIRACLQYTALIIVVDDGSNDNTVEILNDLPIQLIQHAHNQGKSLALKHGFEAALQYAEISAILTLDADGQHDVNDVQRFIQKHLENPQALLIGARTENAEHAPKYRLWANKTADFFISKAAGKKIHDTQSGYRLHPRDLLEKILPNISHFDSFTFETEILIDSARAGFDIQFIPIRSHYPLDLRPSRFKPVKDTVKIAKLICRKLFTN